MTAGRAVALRLVVTVVVAMMVVAVSGVLPLLGGPGGGGGVDEGPDHQAYEADRLVADRLAADGEADPDGDVGTVLFDQSHENRFDREDVSPLTGAIERAGGDVQFSERTGSLASQLRNADVLVVVDPASPYGPDEVAAVEEFVDNGGRVVILGEPNRKELQRTGLSASLVTERSRVTSLASAFGISYGTHYVYDLEHNDGNFKNVVVEPGDGGGMVDDIDRVAMYTAVEVEADRGTVLLRTAPTAERANEDPERGFPVAVVSADGSVLAVGDKTFASDEYHSVADNDVFLARMVEFMTEADHEPPREEPTETTGPPASLVARPGG